MSLSDTFNQYGIDHQTAKPSVKRKAKRPAPFSLRLSGAERGRLIDEAGAAPLGVYIKAKLLGNPLPVRMPLTSLAVENRKALAQTLALLGNSRLASNLNQLAHAANVGALPMTPETEAELMAAVSEVRHMRSLLLAALGLKPEATP